jgi:predicted O-linked N-acetylglucosamine transferase (SPINDLY family)
MPRAGEGRASAAAVTVEAAIDLDELGSADGGGAIGSVEAADELLIAELSDRLRADPNDVATVRALAAALERTARDHELLALLSARIEEGPAELRAELEPRRRAALERLRQRAVAAGKHDEAALYALMLEAG